MEYRVERETAGTTVLEVAKRKLGISTALLKHLKFLDNGICVDGKRVTVRYVLQEGDVLTLAVEDTASGETATPADLPLPVLYEDEDTVVPNKPSDMPTHPSCGHREDTVANALAFRYRSRGIPFVFRPVNRLDRNTSGLLLIGRNRIAAARLSEGMRQGRIRKVYLAILAGVPQEESGWIRTYMRRTERSVILRENCEKGQGGDFALTRYRVLLQSESHSLVCAAPLTGRTHQLRVHFAGIGCPILGDDLYGSPSNLIGRHALHSCVLTFPRVRDGAPVTVRSPLPKDMAMVARLLFGAESDAVEKELLLWESDLLRNEE